MNATSRERLLKIARAGLESAITDKSTPTLVVDEPELQTEAGCFVTLHVGGRLRGCLGHFTSDKPLYQLVMEMACASATQDPRFIGNRITPEELPRVKIEISVLSPLEPIANPLDIELGTHGIQIRNGMAVGCFLPQVATEQGWSKEEFLGYCCSHKAGLGYDAWKDPDTEVEVFTAEVFSDKD